MKKQQKDYGLLISSMVAIVAVVGLVVILNQQNAITSGAFLSLIKGDGFDKAPKLISDKDNFVYQGRMFFDECHVNPEKMAAELKKAHPEEAFSETKCCSFSCQDFCLGKKENCYGLCRAGCNTESEVIHTK